MDPFYMTLLINKKMVKKCIIDLGATINIISFEFMKDLGLWIDTTYGKFYSMDNRSILVAGIMKDVEIKIVACLEAACKIDIIVVDVAPGYGILLCR